MHGTTNPKKQNIVYTHHGILMSATILSYLLSRVLAAVKCYHITTYNSHMDIWIVNWRKIKGFHITVL